MRGYHATEAYQKALRKRKVWVEPLFAEAKDWHRLRRLRLRGLMNANIQGMLIAAGQNLKRFLAARGWGRRHAPCGSHLALPLEPERLSALRVMTHSAGDRSTGEPDPKWLVTAPTTTKPFFNTLGRYRNQRA